VREYQTVTQLEWESCGRFRRCSDSVWWRTSAEALRVAARLQEVESADRAATTLREASEESSRALATASPRSSMIIPHSRRPGSAILTSRSGRTRRISRRLIWLEQWIAEDGPSAEEAATRSNRRGGADAGDRREQHHESSYDLASRLEGLRRIAERYGKTSASGSSGHYTSMTFGTRDHYRHVVEHIAKRVKRPEEEIAGEVLALAKVADPKDARHAHVGYFLVDKGRRTLEEKVAYTPPPGEWLYRWTQRHPNTLYFGGMTVFTVLALAVILEVIEGAPAAVRS